MIKRITYIFLLSALLYGCTERIDVTLDETYTRLVVDGFVSTDSGAYQVALTKSADYFFNAPMPRVKNATVTLWDGAIAYALNETVPGISGLYTTDSTFTGQVNRTYTVQIQLPEAISGHTAFDAACYLPPVTHLDSVTYVFHPEYGKEGIWFINLWAQEPGDEVNYYMFNLYRNGKLMTDSIQKKRISDDALINGKYMTGITVFYLNNHDKLERLVPGDTITLQMSGITKEYFQFIDQVQQSGFNLPFFSGPPANVQGNVNNGGVGFFAAYSNSYATTIIR